MTVGILLGLLTATCWGIGDLCVRAAGRTTSAFTALAASQLIALPALLLVGWPSGQIRLAGQSWQIITLTAAISLVNLLGGWLLYRAFTHGTISILSPIVSAFAVVTAALAFLSGERLAVAPLLGIVLAIAGVVVASISRPAKPTVIASGHRHSVMTGVPEAIGAMLSFGVGYWALKLVVPSLGGLTTVLVGRMVSFVVVGALALLLVARSGGLGAGLGGFRQRRLWAFMVPSVLLDLVANIAYNAGITVAPTSIVVTISSLFSAVTVVLAWIFLRERLALWQWAGVVGILTGIALVSM
jgi:drug/metabolite transporter (DMT)-like permease